MNITPIAKGLAQVGRYALGRRQHEQALKERVALEMMREAAWRRRLREQAAAQERLKKYLLEQYKIREQEQTRRKALEEAAKLNRWQQEYDLKKQELELKKKSGWFKRVGGKGVSEPKPPTGFSSQWNILDQEIKRLLEPYSEVTWDEFGEKQITNVKWDEIPQNVMGRYNELRAAQHELMNRYQQTYGLPTITPPIPRRGIPEPYDLSKMGPQPLPTGSKSQSQTSRDQRFRELQQQFRAQGYPDYQDRAFKQLQKEFPGQF